MHKPDRVSTAADQERGLGVKEQEDIDMQRAIDLMDLHYGVKMKHVQGEDAGLTQARKKVDVILERLEANSANKIYRG